MKGLVLFVSWNLALLDGAKSGGLSVENVVGMPV